MECPKMSFYPSLGGRTQHDLHVEFPLIRLLPITPSFVRKVFFIETKRQKTKTKTKAKKKKEKKYKINCYV
jgi:hypothetical protein